MHPLPPELTVEPFDPEELRPGGRPAWLLTHRETRLTLQVEFDGADWATVWEACTACRVHGYSGYVVEAEPNLAHCTYCGAEWATSSFEPLHFTPGQEEERFWAALERSLEVRGLDPLTVAVVQEDLRRGLAHLFAVGDED